jgi:hypothetical protein
MGPGTKFSDPKGSRSNRHDARPDSWESNALAVDDFVAVKAHDFNKAQQTSTNRVQQVQQQSLGINKIQ